LPPGVVQFDEFELDYKRYQLLRAGRRIKLEKLPMELLMLLLEKEGHLVTREEIVNRLWGKGVFLDTEHGINTAVRKIRNVLRDNPELPRFVQTVTGKGYRFVAPITVVGNGNRSEARPSSAVTAHSKNDEEATFDSAQRRLIHPDRVGRTASIPRLSARSVLRITTLVLTVAVVLAGTIIGMNVAGLRTRLFAHEEKARIQSLAVLPLENLSGDPSQDYFADGMTDELITMLAKNARLRVISRTSVMQYKKAQRPVRDIARELGVDGILEGSVSRSASRVHVNTQLIYAPSDTHLWADSYDRDLRDLGSLQSELAETIARQVGFKISPAAVPVKQVSPQTHDAYLMGRYYWFTDNYKKSRESFQKAIDLQPDYAAAWSGLADSLLARGVVGGRALREEVIGPGGDAARKALALDDSIAEAHNSVAAYYFFYRWDWHNAERESARALELNPGFAEGHHLRAFVLQALHRTDEAVQEEKKAMDLNPFARPWGLAMILIHARRFDEALAEARLRTDTQPGDPGVHEFLSEVYFFKGMEKESIEENATSLQLAGEKGSAFALRKAYARGGYKATLEWELKDLNKKSRTGNASPLHFAAVYAELKDTNETLRYLRQAYDEREPWLAHIQYLPWLDFVHSDPRYQAIVKKMGLPPDS